ncbi:autoinducer binding domain-containing protein [Marinobacterium rhizophilum]|uniref:autoinducer binding domain-containing protein n=1 Tax=Marinobacterium rhizophilum TaxID=420402 RepID=UPI00036EAC7E|nr:autoinducer binding domain-containing protein [Marinobacterium rhizophilum]
MPDLTDLELCIELIHSAETPEEAFSYFCQIVEASGYDRVVYSLLTDHPSLGLPKLHGLASSYPEDWMKHYNEHEYLKIDPVVQEVLKIGRPCFWNDVITNTDLSEDANRLLHEGADAGLQSGISFPMVGLAGEVAGFAIARSDPAPTKNDYDLMARLYLLGTFFHETYRNMYRQQKRGEIPQLTEREHDVLLWAAEGKTDQEIAIILGITFHTVRFHWRQIFRKLDVKGRSYAITKSIRLGLVTPEIVRAPYQHW